MRPTTFPARYRGQCADTGAAILPGDYIRNARGRCEDAPCCGCCTI